MQKIYCVLALLALPLLAAQAQQTGKTTPGSANATSGTTRPLAEKIFRQALTWGDYASATTALHQLVASDGTKSHWRDTLLLVYFQSGAFLSSHLLAAELRKERPENEQILSIDAMSLARIGAVREAIVAFETLYARNPKPNYGYELANLQYSIKRLAEADQTLESILKLDIPATLNARLSGPNGTQQEVSLKAAAYNLRGLVAFDLKQNDKSKGYFEAALKLVPTFDAPQQNLKALEAANLKTASDPPKGN